MFIITKAEKTVFKTVKQASKNEIFKLKANKYKSITYKQNMSSF